MATTQKRLIQRHNHTILKELAQTVLRVTASRKNQTGPLICPRFSACLMTWLLMALSQTLTSPLMSLTLTKWGEVMKAVVRVISTKAAAMIEVLTTFVDSNPRRR